MTAAIAAIAQTAGTTPGGEISRFCGRFLNTAADATTSVTVCCKYSGHFLYFDFLQRTKKNGVFCKQKTKKIQQHI